MIYQALIGAWPHGADRWRFRRNGSRNTPSRPRAKASSKRAGSIRTRATSRACASFVRAILDRGSVRRISRIVCRVLPAAQRCSARSNSLSQLVLKATMPGVPDFYQGTEIWDLSLVDPDNRRPVDFAARPSALAAMGGAPDWTELASHWTDGRIKLALTQRLLALRKELAPVFRDGHYEPVEVDRARSRSHRGVPPFGGPRSRRGRGRPALRRPDRSWQPAGRTGWQAELSLDQRHRQGLRDALGGVEDAEASRSHICSAALPVAVLRSR